MWSASAWSKRALRSEIVGGQGAGIAGGFAGLVELSSSRPAFGDDLLGRFQDCALGGFPPLRLGLAGRFGGRERIAPIS